MFSDYLEHLDYIIDAMDNMYRNINAMPLVAYTKHAMNTIEKKVRICGF
jgi:tRNA A37 threonylcarbamoyladenosine dehydratase